MGLGAYGQIQSNWIDSFKQYYTKLEAIKTLPHNPKINDLLKIRNLLILLNYDADEYPKLKKIILFSESNFANGFDQIIKSKFVVRAVGNVAEIGRSSTDRIGLVSVDTIHA